MNLLRLQPVDADGYWCVQILNEQGECETLLLTSSELARIRERSARKNIKEQFPPPAAPPPRSFFDNIRNLFS